jgi:phosphotransferase system IIB component
MSLTAVGGFANISTTINASATQLIQTFTIAFVNNATIPNKANTEIKSIW